MGIFSEGAASFWAGVIEKMIVKAKATGNSEIIKFAKDVIYKGYLDAKGEAWETPKKFEEIGNASNNG